MQESRESINLMRLNGELINTKNSTIYSKGVYADHHSIHYMKSRLMDM